MDLTTLKTVIGSARAVFPHVATKQDASYLRGVDAGLVAALEPLETDGTMSATEALQVLSRAHSSFDVTDPLHTRAVGGFGARTATAGHGAARGA